MKHSTNSKLTQPTGLDSGDEKLASISVWPYKHIQKEKLQYILEKSFMKYFLIFNGKSISYRC